MKCFFHSIVVTVFFVSLLSGFCVGGVPKIRRSSFEKMFEEFSGDDSSEIDDDDENLISKTEDHQISIYLDVKNSWNENFLEINSPSSEILDEALRKYSSDLLTKYSKSGKIKITDLKIDPLASRDQRYIKLTARCISGKEETKMKKLECKSIARIIERNFNVNELLRYFHEIGFQEKVNEGKLKQIN